MNTRMPTTMRRTIIGLCTAASTFALVACGSAQRTSKLSILNESTTDVTLTAWIGAEGASNRLSETTDTLEAGQSTAFSLTSNTTDGEPMIVVSVAPTAGGEPLSLALRPPSPYLLRIMGNAESITLMRDQIEVSDPRAGSLGIPETDQNRINRGGL